jgi:hypothetical protein
MKISTLLKGSVFFLVFLIQASTSFAQLPPEVSAQVAKLTPNPAFKSPNVTAMEKYGDYQVNLYTGIPDISIPLFEIESGPIKVPIVLSYHASGFKYTDQASWVGLGWSLQAGGQVSRSFQGKPDESSFLTISNDYNVPGGGDCNNLFYKENTINGGNDREPDLFNYTFPGSNGKFYLRQNGADPYLVPYQPIKITRNGISYFDIVDTRGLAHRFGANWAGGSSAVEAMSSQGGSNNTSGVVAWHLQEIKSPNSDDFVSFTYQTVGTIASVDHEYNLSVIDMCNTNNATDLPCTNTVGIVQQVVTSSSTTQIGINEIFFKTGKVKFILGPNRVDLPNSPNVKSLARIEVYRKEGTDYFLVKSYIFNNNEYFKRQNTSENVRLKLNGIDVRDGAGTLINKYGFQYYTNNFSWDLASLSKARDYFGFYNGKTSNADLIPTTTISYQPNIATAPSNINIGSANRSTDTTFLKEAMLKRITFPTGGYTEFDYEAHSYSELGVNTIVPGLRVKKIASVTGSSIYFKTYKYGAGENGLGQKNFDLRGFYFSSEQKIRSSCFRIPCDREQRSRMYFSNSVIGPGYEDAPVVYTNVAEYENGTNANGKTVYEFDNNSLIGDPLFSVPYSNKTFRNSMSWARGKLTKKTYYKSDGSKTSETQVSYYNYGDQTSNIGQAGYQWINGTWGGPLIVDCGSGKDGKEFSMINLGKTTGNYLETSRVETLFGSAGPLTTTTNKVFNATFLQPQYEEVISSGNPYSVRTNYRYPFDIINTATNYSGAPNALKQMQLKNMISSPVEQYVWIKQTSTASPEYVSGQVTEYDLVPSTDFYKPKSIYVYETAAPSTSYALVGVSGTTALTRDSKYKLKATMESFDLRGNVLQYGLTDGIKKSFIYGYEGTYLIGEATNSPGTTFAYTSFETNEKGGWDYNGTESLVMAGEAKTGKKVYLLNNGQISKVYKGGYKLSFWIRKNSSSPASLSINGVSYSGTIDDTWRLVETTGSGGTITISGSGTIIDELRVHATMGLATTYAMIPMIGISSAMDSKNQGIYYLYDFFGRLVTIKNEDGHILSHTEYNYINQ